MAAVAARQGFRRMFSSTAFQPWKSPVPPPKSDPSPNLFVSDFIGARVRDLVNLKEIDMPGLSKRTTPEGLREAFGKFGRVIHAKVITDHISGYSKGFGFVRYETVEEAARGIEGMDGKFLDGWVIFAEYAKPRQPPQQEQGTIADKPPQY